KVELLDRQHLPGSNDNTDGIFGGSDLRRLPIQVNNVAPSFVQSSISVTKELNRSITVDGAFTDPGTLDTEQVTANWNDPYATGSTTCALGADNRHFHCQHTYHQTIGVTTYRIALVARDDDDGTGAYQASVTLP